MNVFALFFPLEINYNEFYKVFSEILMTDPSKRPQRFSIVGYVRRTVEVQMNIVNLSSSSAKATLSRSIEFPPEYHQAGVGILNYFGTYLTQQYPDEQAKVTIEQDGLMVRLIVETKDGELNIVEKALDEYEKIMSGRATPEKFTKNEKLIIGLKTELRVRICKLKLNVI